MQNQFIIGEFCKVSAGGTPDTSNKNYWEGGNIPWMSSGEIHKKRIKETSGFITKEGLLNSSAKIFPINTVLIALAGQGKTRGAVAISKIELSTNQSLAGIISDPSICLPEFLYYNLSNRYQELRSESGGSGRAGLNLSIISNLTINLPSLLEQKKIVEILFGIDQLLLKKSNQIYKLQYLYKGLINLFLNFGINHTLFKGKDSNFLPNGWHIKKLEEVSMFRRGSFPQPYGRKEWYEDNGYPFVQVYDIDDNNKLKSTTKARISELAAKKSVFIPKGSLIVSIQGSIGRVAITQYDAYVDRTILIFNNFDKYFDKRFLAILIKELFLQQGQIADGGIIKTITKQTLSEFKVKIPPLVEQTKIAEILSSVELNIELNKRKLLQIQKTKQSLMQDLLSGHKRVNV